MDKNIQINQDLQQKLIQNWNKNWKQVSLQTISDEIIQLPQQQQYIYAAIDEEEFYKNQIQSSSDSSNLEFQSISDKSQQDQFDPIKMQIVSWDKSYDQNQTEKPLPPQKLSLFKKGIRERTDQELEFEQKNFEKIQNEMKMNEEKLEMQRKQDLMKIKAELQKNQKNAFSFGKSSPQKQQQEFVFSQQVETDLDHNKQYKHEIPLAPLKQQYFKKGIRQRSEEEIQKEQQNLQKIQDEIEANENRIIEQRKIDQQQILQAQQPSQKKKRISQKQKMESAEQQQLQPTTEEWDQEYDKNQQGEKQLQPTQPKFFKKGIRPRSTEERQKEQAKQSQHHSKMQQREQEIEIQRQQDKAKIQTYASQQEKKSFKKEEQISQEIQRVEDGWDMDHNANIKNEQVLLPQKQYYFKLGIRERTPEQKQKEQDSYEKDKIAMQEAEMELNAKKAVDNAKIKAEMQIQKKKPLFSKPSVKQSKENEEYVLMQKQIEWDQDHNLQFKNEKQLPPQQQKYFKTGIKERTEEDKQKEQENFEKIKDLMLEQEEELMHKRDMDRQKILGELQKEESQTQQKSHKKDEIQVEPQTPKIEWDLDHDANNKQENQLPPLKQLHFKKGIRERSEEDKQKEQENFEKIKDLMLEQEDELKHKRDMDRQKILGELQKKVQKSSQKSLKQEEIQVEPQPPKIEWDLDHDAKNKQEKQLSPVNQLYFKKGIRERSEEDKQKEQENFEKIKDLMLEQEDELKHKRDMDRQKILGQLQKKETQSSQSSQKSLKQEEIQVEPQPQKIEWDLDHDAKNKQENQLPPLKQLYFKKGIRERSEEDKQKEQENFEKIKDLMSEQEEELKHKRDMDRQKVLGELQKKEQKPSQKSQKQEEIKVEPLQSKIEWDIDHNAKNQQEKQLPPVNQLHFKKGIRERSEEDKQKEQENFEKIKDLMLEQEEEFKHKRENDRQKILGELQKKEQKPSQKSQKQEEIQVELQPQKIEWDLDHNVKNIQEKQLPPVNQLHFKKGIRVRSEEDKQKEQENFEKIKDLMLEQEEELKHKKDIDRQKILGELQPKEKQYSQKSTKQEEIQVEQQTPKIEWDLDHNTKNQQEKQLPPVNQLHFKKGIRVRSEEDKQKEQENFEKIKDLMLEQEEELNHKKEMDRQKILGELQKKESKYSQKSLIQKEIQVEPQPQQIEWDLDHDAKNKQEKQLPPQNQLYFKKGIRERSEEDKQKEQENFEKIKDVMLEQEEELKHKRDMDRQKILGQLQKKETQSSQSSQKSLKQEEIQVEPQPQKIEWDLDYDAKNKQEKQLPPVNQLYFKKGIRERSDEDKQKEQENFEKIKDLMLEQEEELKHKRDMDRQKILGELQKKETQSSQSSQSSQKSQKQEEIKVEPLQPKIEWDIDHNAKNQQEKQLPPVNQLHFKKGIRERSEEDKQKEQENFEKIKDLMLEQEEEFKHKRENDRQKILGELQKKEQKPSQKSQKQEEIKLEPQPPKIEWDLDHDAKNKQEKQLLPVNQLHFKKGIRERSEEDKQKEQENFEKIKDLMLEQEEEFKHKKEMDRQKILGELQKVVTKVSQKSLKQEEIQVQPQTPKIEWDLDHDVINKEEKQLFPIKQPYFKKGIRERSESDKQKEQEDYEKNKDQMLQFEEKLKVERAIDRQKIAIQSESKPSSKEVLQEAQVKTQPEKDQLWDLDHNMKFSSEKQLSPQKQYYFKFGIKQRSEEEIAKEQQNLEKINAEIKENEQILQQKKVIDQQKIQQELTAEQSSKRWFKKTEPTQIDEKKVFEQQISAIKVPAENLWDQDHDQKDKNEKSLPAQQQSYFKRGIKEKSDEQKQQEQQEFEKTGKMELEILMDKLETQRKMERQKAQIIMSDRGDFEDKSEFKQLFEKDLQSQKEQFIVTKPIIWDLSYDDSKTEKKLPSTQNQHFRKGIRERTQEELTQEEKENQTIKQQINAFEEKLEFQRKQDRLSIENELKKPQKQKEKKVFLEQIIIPSVSAQWDKDYKEVKDEQALPPQKNVYFLKGIKSQTQVEEVEKPLPPQQNSMFLKGTKSQTQPIEVENQLPAQSNPMFSKGIKSQTQPIEVEKSLPTQSNPMFMKGIKQQTQPEEVEKHLTPQSNSMFTKGIKQSEEKPVIKEQIVLKQPELKIQQQQPKVEEIKKPVEQPKPQIQSQQIQQPKVEQIQPKVEVVVHEEPTKQSKQFFTDQKSIAYYVSQLKKDNPMRYILQNSIDHELNNCLINTCGGVDKCHTTETIQPVLQKCVDSLYHPHKEFFMQSEQEQHRCIIQCQLKNGISVDSNSFFLKSKEQQMKAITSFFNFENQDNLTELNKCVLMHDKSWNFFTKYANTNNPKKFNQFFDTQILSCYENMEKKIIKKEVDYQADKCAYQCYFDRSKAKNLMNDIKNFSGTIQTEDRLSFVEKYLK